MATNEFFEAYKDPRWQKLRLEIFQRDRFTCLNCADSTAQLHVHHRYYASGKAPWEYEPASLMTLCDRCHEDENVGGMRAKLVRALAFVNPLADRALLAFLQTMAANNEQADGVTGDDTVCVPDTISINGVATALRCDNDDVRSCITPDGRVRVKDVYFAFCERKAAEERARQQNKGQRE